MARRNGFKKGDVEFYRHEAEMRNNAKKTASLSRSLNTGGMSL
jgi:hypothetical protein